MLETIPLAVSGAEKRRPGACPQTKPTLGFLSLSCHANLYSWVKIAINFLTCVCNIHGTPPPDSHRRWLNYEYCSQMHQPEGVESALRYFLKSHWFPQLSLGLAKSHTERNTFSSIFPRGNLCFHASEIKSFVLGYGIPRSLAMAKSISYSVCQFTSTRRRWNIAPTSSTTTDSGPTRQATDTDPPDQR